MNTEDEVQKILRERGFETADETKRKPAKHRANSRRPKHKKLLILSLSVILIFLISTVATFMFHLGEQDFHEFNGYASKNETESENYAALSECLSLANTEVSADDDQFWPKLIASYKAQIDCHDQFPTEDSVAQKAEILQLLSDAESSAQNAGISQSQIDAAYSNLSFDLSKHLAEIGARAVENEKKTAQDLAEIDERAKNMEAAYQAQRQAAQSNQQSATGAAQAKKAACEDYKSKYGEKSAQELADDDSAVRVAYSAWQTAQKKIRSCTASNVVLNQSQRDTCNSYRAQEEQAAQSAYSNYNSVRLEKITYYSQLRSSACGY